MVVYDNNGNYVTQKDYKAGQENTAGAMIGLNGGSTYTFIAYSTGSTTSIPSVDTSVNVTSTTSPIVTLSNMSVPITLDLMFYSTTLQVSGNSMNYLNINFSHKFSQIITTLDASSTGYTIKAVNANIDSNFNNASLFGNGTYNSTGTGSNFQTQSLTFPSLGLSTATANPIYVNNTAGTNTGIFTINSITMIGGGSYPGIEVTHTNVTFNNLKITPGVLYNLKLSLVANDMYLTYRGYPAVRINGIIWMRHDLGTDTTYNPDVPVQRIFGHYYQWGRGNSVGDSGTLEGPITPWDLSNPGSMPWNSGSHQSPVKTSADPCPTGWRVPSGNETSILKDNTTKQIVGTPASTMQVNNFSVGVAYISNRNSSIRLTLPAGGSRSALDGSLVGRAQNPLLVEEAAQRWTSNYQASGTQAYNMSSASGNGFGITSKSQAMPVRCVAEAPYN